MSQVLKQHATTIKRNGAYVDVVNIGGKAVQLPLTTNFDVMTIAAYWFTRMRDFFIAAEPKFNVWTGYRRLKPWAKGEQRSSLDSWAKTDFAEAVMGGIATPNLNRLDEYAALDAYLALPGANWLDSERTDPSDRFARGPINSIAEALWQRKLTKEASSLPDFGFLITIYSDKQKTSDAIRGTYNSYIRGLVPYWDGLVRCVEKIRDYVLPKTNAVIPGEKIGDLKNAKQFWSTIAQIEYYMAENGAVLDSQLGWGDWVSTAGEAVKVSAEKVIVTGAGMAGDAAAWAANTGGRAYGEFWKEFLGNVGLWGLAFVALLIYTR